MSQTCSCFLKLVQGNVHFLKCRQFEHLIKRLINAIINSVLYLKEQHIPCHVIFEPISR